MNDHKGETRDSIEESKLPHAPMAMPEQILSRSRQPLRSAFLLMSLPGQSREEGNPTT